MPVGVEPLEAAAELVRAGLLVFPLAGDPPGIFESLESAEHPVHGGPGSLRGLSDRPVV